eukprot:1604695-Lingulodinium_polyedra.AAC.1
MLGEGSKPHGRQHKMPSEPLRDAHAEERVVDVHLGEQQLAVRGRLDGGVAGRSGELRVVRTLEALVDLAGVQDHALGT